ncbi:MAG: ATP-dependent DNA helicase [Castellaniella sp.]|uniref:ATP-dependent DNA helicase n=1 Tax=Castellaniella sp. TaxID=1955812 RepID=UPI002A363E1B|nr:ATP-dependent DNA helicase [Castellaniella sp.]MDY0309149.1 ATP-dependent DNA helicase [Castellaniella sp.]
MLNDELAEIFGPDGPLARQLPGYVPRAAQLELAQVIRTTLDGGGVLIAEAGTGTGKTWAYLVPAFLSGSKVLVSTGTRTLQDQLFRRDIPRLRAALALPADVALLKGRGNYVCHYHLERLEQDERGLKSRDEIDQLRAIRRFARESDCGDRADLPAVPETADIWSRVTSTRENCLGQDCPHVRDCFVLKARRHAQDADVVVVNHALFMADLALREEGITDLLPETQLVVFDEAHQLPDTATRFLGQSLSLHQILDCARQAEAAGLAHARETVRWSDLCQALDAAARGLRLASAPVGRLPGGRATFEQIPEADAFDQSLDRLMQALDGLAESLGTQEERHPDLAAAARTARDLRARLWQWAHPVRGGDAVGQGAVPADGVAPDGSGPQAGGEADHQAAVRWVEHSAHSVRLQRAPLSVARIFSGFRRPGQSWVLASATLSVRGDFQHFQRQLGLGDAETRIWASPFDYPAQGLLYVPQGLPWPSDPGFTDAFARALLPLVDACAGGVLVLCTTLRAVDRVADALLRGMLASDRPVMRQGEASRGVLLERFRAAGNAVLVGSTSFWEGIDVPGDALTLVAIDKLPFAPPDDPVLEARLNVCRAEGGNPFMEYQLPQAALLLKQGAGRLIRSETDWGVLVVGDGRLVDKPYGRLLWQGLPPFARTRDAGVALDFLANPPESAAGWLPLATESRTS